MSHESYQWMISLSLDEMLDAEEQRVLYEHMRTCAHCAALWSRMNDLDRVLSAQPEMPAPVDFTSRVMARVDGYERRRRWQPWLIGLTVFASVMGGLSLAAPILFFSLGLDKALAASPLLTALFTQGAALFGETVGIATFLAESLVDWLSYLSTNPVALAVVLAGLVTASTYIGLREAIRIAARAEGWQRVAISD